MSSLEMEDVVWIENHLIIEVPKHNQDLDLSSHLVKSRICLLYLYINLFLTSR